MLTPDSTYQANGVTVNVKILPDGQKWKSASKATAAGFNIGALYKANRKLTGPLFVTIHNTADLAKVNDDGEQYTRATFNENMGSARVHFYVDDTGAWQNLKAGTGMAGDPLGSAEVSWHSGDGSRATGGNQTSLSIEIIMNESPEHDAKAYDNGARMAAYLLKLHGLSIDKLVTHTYWVNKLAGKTFSDPDEQSTNLIAGKKWCPTYIFGSRDHATALKNWKAFKDCVRNYLTGLSGGSGTDTPPATKTTVYRVRKVWEDSRTQLGAFNSLENAKRLADSNPGYVVFDEDGKPVYPTADLRVQVLVSDLRIRTGPGTNYDAKGYTGIGTFTITEVRPGQGSTAGWGRLKSGAGWISMDYVK